METAPPPVNPALSYLSVNQCCQTRINNKLTVTERMWGGVSYSLPNLIGLQLQLFLTFLILFKPGWNWPVAWKLPERRDNWINSDSLLLLSVFGSQDHLYHYFQFWLKPMPKIYIHLQSCSCSKKTKLSWMPVWLQNHIISWSSETWQHP